MLVLLVTSPKVQFHWVTVPEFGTDVSVKPTDLVVQLMVSVNPATGNALTVMLPVTAAELHPAAEVTVRVTVFMPELV